MDCKDLMVGDLVYVVRGYDKHLTIEKIKGVIKDEDNLYPVTIFTGETVSLNDIKPIPLTEEILVKISDFTVRGEYVISGTNRYPYIRIAWSRDKEKFYFSTLGSNCYLEYVHQLQHLLRLCGLKKEIEL